MPITEHLRHFVRADAPLLQKHQQVIDEVRRLLREPLIRERRYDHLYGLLPDLLRQPRGRRAGSGPAVYDSSGISRCLSAIVAASRSAIAPKLSAAPVSPTATPTPSPASVVKKQVLSPVWQAGPRGFTR